MIESTNTSAKHIFPNFSVISLPMKVLQTFTTLNISMNSPLDGVVKFPTTGLPF